MTQDEISRQIAEDIEKLEQRIEQEKDTLKSLRSALADRYAELKNVALGGGFQTTLDIKGDEDADV